MNWETAGIIAAIVVVGFIISQITKKRKGGKGKPSGNGRDVENN